MPIPKVLEKKKLRAWLYYGKYRGLAMVRMGPTMGMGSTGEGNHGRAWEGDHRKHRQVIVGSMGREYAPT